MDHIAKEISFSDNSARGIVLTPSGGVYLAPYAGNGVRNLHIGTIHGRYDCRRDGLSEEAARIPSTWAP